MTIDKGFILCRAPGALGDALEAGLSAELVMTPKGPYAPQGDDADLAPAFVCNALVLQLTPTSIEQATEREFKLPSDDVWQLHDEWLDRVIRIAQRAGRGMIQRRSGKVVFILPAEVKQPHELRVIDSAYAAALQALAKHIANEWTNAGIAVNTLLWRGEEEGLASRMQSLVALITHLLSDPSAHISGAAIAVDGGYGQSLF